MAKEAKTKVNNLPRKAPKEGEVGVQYIADELEIGAASVRVKLRKANIETNESGVYSWSKTRADAIVKQLKATPKKEAA